MKFFIPGVRKGQIWRNLCQEDNEKLLVAEVLEVSFGVVYYQTSDPNDAPKSREIADFRSLYRRIA